MQAVLVGALMIDEVVDVDAGSRPSVDVLSALTTMRIESTCSTTPSRPRYHRDARVAGHHALHPVPTSGASVRSRGTACRCMFEAHEGAVRVVVLEERDERRGHDTSWFGDTSMNGSTCSRRTMVNSRPMREERRSP